MALPVVAAPQQQVMAVSVLACERVLAGLDGRPPGWLDQQSRAVLAQVPQAARWARGFAGTVAISPKAFRHHSAPATVHAAVEGIAQACVPQPDQMLHDLLASAIGECATWCGPDAHQASAATPPWWPPTDATAVFPAGHGRSPAPGRPCAHSRPLGAAPALPCLLASACRTRRSARAPAACNGSWGWSLALRPWRGTGSVEACWLDGGPAALTDGREGVSVSSGPSAWQGRSLTLCTMPPPTSSGSSRALVMGQLPGLAGIG